MNFSTNQVMQFYTLDGVTAAAKKYPLENAAVVTFTDASGEIRVTDKIKNVAWGKLTTADALAKSYKKVTVTMTEIKEGADYVVRVSYPEVAGLGVEGWTTKTAVAHASKGTIISDIYTTLVENLKAALATDGVLEVKNDSGIVINPTDVTKGYKRGLRPVIIPDFKVETNLIKVDGEDVDWATQTVGTVAGMSVKSGYAVADMEYFAMGERGDQYRMMAWPNMIETEYKVDPKAEYDVLVVHYAYKGANEGDYKSEKDLVIVGKTGTVETLAKALETAVGVDFTKVSVEESGTVEAAL